MFIDVHTHCNRGGASIYNLAPGEKPIDGLFSAGVHPWQADQYSPASAIALLESLQKHPQYVAVGEIGIDRACAVPILQQAALFECQLQWAAEHNKPCIIHSVRAYSDIQQVLKRQKRVPAIIFHAYSGNEAVTEQLLRFGAFFSLGMRELMHKDMQHIPPERLFLETDEHDCAINSVYELASRQQGVVLDVLTTVVAQNARQMWPQCFG